MLPDLNILIYLRTIQYESDEATFLAIGAMNRYRLDGQKLDVVLGPHSAKSQKNAFKDWMIDFKLVVNYPYQILMTTTEFQKNLKKL